MCTLYTVLIGTLYMSGMYLIYTCTYIFQIYNIIINNNIYSLKSQYIYIYIYIYIY